MSIVAVVLLSMVSLIGHTMPLLAEVGRAPIVAGPTPAPTSTTTRPSASPSSQPSPTTSAPGPTSGPVRDAAVPPTPRVDNTCMRADNPRTGATFPAGDPFGADIARYGAGAKLQRLFAVKNGALTPVDGLGAPRACDAQLWALVTTLAPTQVGRIDEFLIYDSGRETSQGRKIGESAPKQVSSRSVDEAHWRLSVAPNGLDRTDLAWLVAHELGHIASLNNTQMSGTRGSCPTERTFTGCLTATSYLYRYLQHGWPTDLVSEWEDADASPEAGRATALRGFFQKHRASFVTAYAASHPLEDFAESFAMWCTFAPDETTRATLPRKLPSDSGSKVDWFATATTDLVPEFQPGCVALQRFAAG